VVETTESRDAEAIARTFHEAYERLAPSFDYETREASAVPWEDVPEQNRSLMVAVVGEVLASLRSTSRDSDPPVTAAQQMTDLAAEYRRGFVDGSTSRDSEVREAIEALRRLIGLQLRPEAAPTQDRLAGFRIREGDPAARLPAFDVTGAYRDPASAAAPVVGLSEEALRAALNAHMQDFYAQPESYDTIALVSNNVVRHYARLTQTRTLGEEG
jgi:hypothetical protein